jgi:hypothetical protein
MYLYLLRGIFFFHSKYFHVIYFHLYFSLRLYAHYRHFFYNLQSEVFAVAFALLAAGAVILTLNVLLLVIPSLSYMLHITFCLGISFHLVRQQLLKSSLQLCIHKIMEIPRCC